MSRLDLAAALARIQPVDAARLASVQAHLDRRARSEEHTSELQSLV